MAEGGKRPFWMHQLVEYILGGALVATGLQSPYPAVPAVLGGIIMLHAAITRGALAAFQVLDRRVHRMLDPFVIGVVFVGAAQPWVTVDPGTRVIIAGVGAVHLVVWLGSSFHEKPKAAPKSPKSSPSSSPSAPGSAAGATGASGAATSSSSSTAEGRSAEIGRSAGRIVGSGVNAARRTKDKYTKR